MVGMGGGVIVRHMGMTLLFFHHPHQIQTLAILYIMLIIIEQSHHHATGFEIMSFYVLGKKTFYCNQHASSRANDGITTLRV